MSRTLFLLFCLLAAAKCLHSQSSLPHYLDSLKGTVDSQVGIERVSTLLHIAANSNYVGEYDSAEVYATHALALLQPEDPDTLRIDGLSDLSVSLMNQGNHVKAMEGFTTVLDQSEKLNDRKRIAGAWHNLGTVYFQDKQFRQAIVHTQKGVRIYEEQGNPLSRELIRGQTSLGISYMFAGSYDTSLVWLMKAKQATMIIQDDQSTLGVVYYLGLNYRYLNRYEDALEAYFEAMPLAKSLGNKAFVSASYQSIAGIYDLQGKHQLAIENLDSALHIAKEIGNKSLIFESLYGLAQNYHKSGQHLKAYAYLKKHIAAKDSVLKEQNALAIAEMKAKYEAEKQEQKIVLLESQDEAKQLKLQVAYSWQYGLVGAIVLFVLIIIVLLNRFLIKQRLSLKLLNANRELEIEKENMELKALLSQMNPHFIFNTMNSIQEFIAINDKEKAHEYLSLFGRLIRRTLDNSNQQMVPIQEEILSIEEYVQLESLRVENFTFEIDISPEIDIYNLCIPPMLIQPYIENAIWHGITPLNRSGKISLKMTLSEERLTCVVQDDGIGRDRSAGQKIKSELRTENQPRGTDITQKRVQVLWAKRKHDFEVEIIDLYDETQLATGTKVKIDIPYEY